MGLLYLYLWMHNIFRRIVVPYYNDILVAYKIEEWRMCNIFFNCRVFFSSCNSPTWTWATSLLWIHDHTHTTRGSTPLDKWSARLRDPYLHNTQHSLQTSIHAPGGIRTRHTIKRKNEVGGACGAHGGGDRCAQGSSGETRRKEASGETQT